MTFVPVTELEIGDWLLGQHQPRDNRPMIGYAIPRPNPGRGGLPMVGVKDVVNPRQPLIGIEINWRDERTWMRDDEIRDLRIVSLMVVVGAERAAYSFILARALSPQRLIPAWMHDARREPANPVSWD